LIGARGATFSGGALVLSASLLTLWCVPAVYRFRSERRMTKKTIVVNSESGT
jgi:hypothetical protein